MDGTKNVKDALGFELCKNSSVTYTLKTGRSGFPETASKPTQTLPVDTGCP
jgi:hypothetical protein